MNQTGKISARDSVNNALAEFFLGNSVDRMNPDHVLDPDRRNRRMDILLSKMHVVGDVALPIPNVFALYLIGQLDSSKQVEWTMEAVYILKHQNDRLKLFLTGDERKHELHAIFSGMSQQQFNNQYICLREMLDATEKKNLKFLEHLNLKAQDLIRQANSFSSPKSSGASFPTSRDLPTDR